MKAKNSKNGVQVQLKVRYNFSITKGECGYIIDDSDVGEDDTVQVKFDCHPEPQWVFLHKLRLSRG